MWPYAAGGPLTFMAPGQPVLDTTTRGGWYRAGDDLRQRLIALGLPRRQPLAAPAPTPDAPAPAAPTPASPGPGAGILLVLVAVAALVMALRRRSGPDTAAR